MKTTKIVSQGNVAILQLTNGVTNAINPALVEECTQALQEISRQYQGMVLTGGEKFFSIGLDLPELLTFDRKTLEQFWRRFDQMMLDLYTLPMPTACSVSGHATAGGTILAIACDFRYSAPGKRLMGLNEINIGVPVPYLADLILRQMVEDGVATEMIYGGALMAPERAAAVGLVDEIVEVQDLPSRAVEKVTAIANHVSSAFKFIKQSRVEAIANHYRQTGDTRLEPFLDCWFEPDVQKLLHQAAEKF